MGSEQDPGHDKVTDETRSAEDRDEQATAEAGRGPTPGEEEAAERAEPVSDETREAYQEMTERGAHQKGEGRI
ncbi:MAG: hypothetical protein JXA83_07600 [Acidimicrobiales bacterium]|nr:hypothetical protein [Acidimicrobiales bacterium]